MCLPVLNVADTSSIACEASDLFYFAGQYVGP